MGELGDEAKALHSELGEYAHFEGINDFYSLGQLSEHASIAFGLSGQHFTDRDKLIDALKVKLTSLSEQNVAVLVKGSRSAKMELIVDALTAEFGDSVDE
jgi:UDP-N-acetylmuramoyl-tripeptide--D-alanyl-D-alanine ligase